MNNFKNFYFNAKNFGINSIYGFIGFSFNSTNNKNLEYYPTLYFIFNKIDIKEKYYNSIENINNNFPELKYKFTENEYNFKWSKNKIFRINLNKYKNDLICFNEIEALKYRRKVFDLIKKEGVKYDYY